VAARYQAPAPRPAGGGGGSLILQMIPILYHSGKLSLQAEGLTTIYPKGRLGLSAADSERIGAATGAVVRLTPAATTQPQVEVEVEVQPELPAGLCVFPEHFNTPGVKDLVPATIDPVTHAPCFKRGEVTIRLVTPAPASSSQRAPSDLPAPATPSAAPPKEPAS